MNIFSRLFASPRNLSPAAPVIAVAAQRNASGPGGYCAVRPADAKLDSFQAKYGTPEYLPGIIWRLDRFYLANPPRPNKGMFAGYIKAAQPLFLPDAIEQIVALATTFNRAGDGLLENSFMNVAAKTRASFPGIKAALAKGEPLPPVQGYEETQNRVATIRAALHSIRGDVGKQAFPIIKAACEKFYATGQRLVAEQEAEERGGPFRRWQVSSFTPSLALRQLIFMTLSAFDPIANFEQGIGCLLPTTDPKTLWGHLIESQPAPLAPGTTMQQVREQQRYEEEKRANRQWDREQAERKAKLAEINRFNDALREQGPNSPPFRGGYSATPAKAAPAPTEAPEPAADKQP